MQDTKECSVSALITSSSHWDCRVSRAYGAVVQYNLAGGPGRTSTKKKLVIMLSWGSPMFFLRLYSSETKKKGSSCI